jgi:DNA polymerase-3 subunit alpha
MVFLLVLGMSFVHLHVHSEYSLLDSSVRIEKLVGLAKELNMPAVALTDHGNVYGLIEFYEQAKKAKIKPIFGCEVYVASGAASEKKEGHGKKGYHCLTLLVENEVGLGNLMKLVTSGHLDGFHGVPRADEVGLRKFREGLICLSGSLEGELAECVVLEKVEEGERVLERWLDIFGKDHFYLELMDHGLAQQGLINQQLKRWSEQYGVGMVATNDVHFLKRDEHESHDVMICIGVNANVLDTNRVSYPTEVYFKTAEEMEYLFKDYPGACENSVKIAERCQVDIKLDATSIERYPLYAVPNGGDRDEYMYELCMEGMRQRYGEERLAADAGLFERMKYELSIISRMSFTSYFLIVWDFIHWAKTNGIPVGPGRGSAAGSIVAYALGITDIDPIRFGLIFERFLNPERVSPPDVDIDICQTRRHEVIEYVRQKYGERSVCHIITFGTMGAKSVIRDVGRVLGWSYTDADRLSKMIPDELGIDLVGAVEKNPELKQYLEEDDRAQELWRHAMNLEDLKRNTGIHAAGVVIGKSELDDYIALTRGGEGEVVSQFAMGPLTELGMLKMDFLGLKTLTVLQEAELFVRKEKKGFDLSLVDLDDEATFRLLKRGENMALFQMESGGMINTCKQLGPDKIEEIIAILALYRPGPMQFIPDFIERKWGRSEVVYAHPLLEQISRETYGILVYQEQVQQAANLLAGYSLGQADLLRRAMGKKKPEEMAKQRIVFVEGCAKTNGIAAKTANEIFDLLEKFAAYGFNKSHSAAYGIVSYRTAYMKANYPVEFMAGVLSYELNNTDKIALYIAECQRMGMVILPPDVNESEVRFKPELMGKGKKGIRFGLCAIKNVGEGAMEEAIRERVENGKFKGLDDFAKRLDNRAVNKKLLESLIKAGAFDFSGEGRASMFGRLEQVLAVASSVQKDRKSGQAALFGDFDFTVSQPKSGGKAQQVAEWSLDEMLLHERELLGFYISGHPLDVFRGHYDSKKITKLGEIALLDLKKYMTLEIVGILKSVEVRYSKKDGRAFGSLVLEDYSGKQDMVCWSDDFERMKGVLKVDQVVRMKVKCSKDMKTEQTRVSCIEARELEPLESRWSEEEQEQQWAKEEEVRKEKGVRKQERVAQNRELSKPVPVAKSVVLRLDASKHDEIDLMRIEEVLMKYSGSMPVIFEFKTSAGQIEQWSTEGIYGEYGSVGMMNELMPWLR